MLEPAPPLSSTDDARTVEAKPPAKKAALIPEKAKVKVERYSKSIKVEEDIPTNATSITVFLLDVASDILPKTYCPTVEEAA
ncbi:hypothetical protein HS1genome_1667 [Sulfodiicoccus acidiphilus]|uniref:Uncharacterized protein n=1 Tax=Sulfodiicoccus acidiphilus TaxID=1670455 RepID=A0A348B526_9CREN|nr:hypothetical protein HS1genome_1667 [Sulfodiicoccus acidiphilus]GGT89419.1 hypothetical protein GCM10007116_04080 [Sulfodiicoccus acidiphilus]